MRIIIRLIVLAIIILWIFKFTSDDDVASEVPNKQVTYYPTEVSNTDDKEVVEKPSYFMIDVPYVSEAPEGNWSGDWVNACEEATMAMVEFYYMGVKSVSVLEAKNYLQNLFDEENKIYGHNKNTDASQILELINLHSKFDARIKTNPTIDDIKNEILNDRPVISLHRGFDLKNPNIPFSPVKSSYHTLVVVGYDDSSNEFITHDPGDEKSGRDHRYSYRDFMYSLHDYNKETDKTDGVPTAIFTERK